MWLPLIAQTLSASALQVTQVTSSTAELRGVSSMEAFDLIATPTNWAGLAVASHRVSCRGTRLQAGDRVEELAGAPPLLPLQFDWACEVSDPAAGILALQSTAGAGPFAAGCRREARTTATDGGCTVELSFSYTPGAGAPWALVNLLVRADNALTTRLLLPSAAAGSAVPPHAQDSRALCWRCGAAAHDPGLLRRAHRALGCATYSERAARSPRLPGWCSGSSVGGGGGAAARPGRILPIICDVPWLPPPGAHQVAASVECAHRRVGRKLARLDVGDGNGALGSSQMPTPPSPPLGQCFPAGGTN